MKYPKYPLLPLVVGVWAFVVIGSLAYGWQTLLADEDGPPPDTRTLADWQDCLDQTNERNAVINERNAAINAREGKNLPMIPVFTFLPILEEDGLWHFHVGDKSVNPNGEQYDCG